MNFFNLLGLLTGVALFCGGCTHHEHTPSEPVKAPVLKSRLEAARAITFMNERDEALAAVARDAAGAGETRITKEALQNITFMKARDDAAGVCATKLAAANRHAEAVEIARMITFMNKRDAVLKRLAAGE